MPKKNLVIVESPAKAKTIEKYLGRNYKVIASLGHIRDLPKSQMGIDVDNNYEPKYISIRGKGDTIKKLKQAASKATNIYLAADPDREGEAIAFHLAHILKLDPTEKNRVVFNEITKDAVKNAFKEPRAINMDLVNSQQARRILDRLVGYSISPILWRKVKKGLSAGRVQSIALKLVIDREKQIQEFNPEEYWKIEATFTKGKSNFDASFQALDGKKKELSNEQSVQEILKKVNKEQLFDIQEVVKKERKRNPQAPFTTSALQQEANKRLNFKTRKTMMIAQQLYEGIHLGKKEGTVGLITYMRTDSTRISALAKQEAGTFIHDEFGEEYASHNPKKAKQQENSQDAHEAIRPTSVMRTPESLKEILSRDQFRLYQLIWSRFLASQMTPAVFDTVRADLTQNGVTFRANGSQMKFEGFTKVYKTDTDKKNTKLPVLKEGQQVELSAINPSQHFTQPPARYSEATLVKVLEENGVGRPSTYAPTIDTIQKRYYVKLNGRAFEPTELGEIVDDLIETFFPDIVNIDFTAQLESDLDEIAEQKEQWTGVIDRYYRPFEKELINADEKIEKIQIKDEPAGFNCEICGAPMVIKMGRYGKFYACLRFPDCRNTQAIVKEIGVPCPTCGKGQVIERKSKRNRIFYGCSRYPECEFVSWDKPLTRLCPVDQHFLVEKKIKGGTQVVCPNGDYEEEAQK